MENIFSRNELYWGEDFQNYLKSLKIAVFGLGGVGGFALEALARAGVGSFLIADYDTISKTNINRQIIALHSTVGKKKTEVFKERLLDINGEIEVEIYEGFYSKEVTERVFNGNFKRPDFIIDAIDTVGSKIELIKFAKDEGIKIVSSLGAGNRMDASKLYVTDIKNVTSKDCFIKNVLHKLKKYAGVEEGLTVVTSSEAPHSKKKVKCVECIEDNFCGKVEFTKFTPASTPVVPAVAGYLMANYILTTCYNNFSNKKV